MESHSPYFLRISKRNGANHMIFQPEFQVSQVNDKHPYCFLLLFSYSDNSLRTDNGHLRSAFCSKKIPQNRNVGAVHDIKLQIV